MLSNSFCGLGPETQITLGTDASGDGTASVPITFFTPRTVHLWVMAFYPSNWVDLGVYSITGPPAPGDFTPTPATLAFPLTAGSSSAQTLNVTTAGPFISQVSFTANTPVAGLTCAPVTMTPPNPVTITCTASSAVPAGAYTVTVTGVGGGQTHSVPFNISVSANPMTPTYEGYIDQAGCTGIQGWAWDKNHPTDVISVDLYDGATLITVSPAADFRQDLKDFPKGDGKHAFTINPPPVFYAAGSHTLRLTYHGTNLGLVNSGQSLSCGTPPQYHIATEILSCSLFKGAAWDDLNKNTKVPVGVYDALHPTVLLASVVANVTSTVGGSGTNGFSFAPPPVLLDGLSHSLILGVVGTNGADFIARTTFNLSNCQRVSSYQGVLESVTSKIEGWVMDANHPSAGAAVLNIAVDGQPYSTTTANLLRPDLQRGTGQYGFSVAAPQSLKNGLPHTVHVTTSDGAWSFSGDILRKASSASQNGLAQIGPCFINQPYYSSYVVLNGQSNTDDSTAIPVTRTDQLYFGGTAYWPAGGTSISQGSWIFHAWAQPSGDLDSANAVIGPTPVQQQYFNSSGVGLDYYVPINRDGTQIPRLDPGNYTMGLEWYAPIYCSADNTIHLVTSEATTFRIAVEPTPTITSITPSTIPSDTLSQPFTIQGMGLGTSGTLAFSLPGSSAPAALPLSYSGNGSTVTTQSGVTLPAGSYDVVATVTDYGLGFQPTQGQKKSPAARVTAVGTAPKIYFYGTDITGKTVNVIVGQPISLAVGVDGATVQRALWTVPGTIVDGAGWSPANLAPGTSAATSPSYSPNLALVSPLFYWVDGESSRQVSVTVTLTDGSILSSTIPTYFNVVAPSASAVTAGYLGTSGIICTGCLGGPPPSTHCTFNGTIYPSCVSYGIDGPVDSTWGEHSYVGDANSDFAGLKSKFRWVQTVSLSRQIVLSGYPETTIHLSCDGLDSGSDDGTYAYSNGGSITDAPNSALPTDAGWLEHNRSDSFVTTLMFRPTNTIDAEGVVTPISGTIYVPVAQVNWNWNSIATFDGSTWSLPYKSANTPQFAQTTQYPTWNNWLDTSKPVSETPACLSYVTLSTGK